MCLYALRAKWLLLHSELKDNMVKNTLLSKKQCLLFILSILTVGALSAQQHLYKVYQFPPDKIPRIDGETSDWDMVPDSYVVTSDSLVDNTEHYQMPNPESSFSKVKVGWVKGMNRLFFLVELWDNCWIFDKHPRNSDLFELVVDGDRSGGPFINSFHPFLKERGNAAKMISYMDYHGCQAQNYHIFTPTPPGKDWTMVWGPQTWIKELPYANAAYTSSFRHGQNGKLILEFWVTPFDYAGAEGPQRSVESILAEDKIIGLSWAVMDYDKEVEDAGELDAFWSLSKNQRMYGDATAVNPFRLMPLETQWAPKLKADFTSHVIDARNRVVAFTNESVGKVKEYHWDFGDGMTSTEKSPVHQYKKGDKYHITLRIKGEKGESKRIKPWDVALK